MKGPQAGDILIRNTGVNTFVLVEAISGRYIAGPFQGFERAVSAAHARAVRTQALWHQPADNLGHPIGNPVMIVVT